MSSSSILNALDFGAMGTLEARKGDWGGMLDMQYVKLGVSNRVAGGLLGGYNVDFVQQIYTLAGARYVRAKTDLDISPSLSGPGGQIGSLTRRAPSKVLPTKGKNRRRRQPLAICAQVPVPIDPLISTNENLLASRDSLPPV
ncbi:hypothetical protein [Variovorax sp. YR216]|uniref:hypothetical protein n=1 Tax=Variovorax sp. YR216 TaxID=1882828 RepID=UPI00115FE880|nr:hypothetical protein [Variovorax sp. YR216]